MVRCKHLEPAAKASMVDELCHLLVENEVQGAAYAAGHFSWIIMVGSWVPR